MSQVPAKAYCGPVTIDVSREGEILYDIPAGATHRLRRERPGIPDVLRELAIQIPAHGESAGIVPQTYKEILVATDAIDRLRAARTDVAKLLEVITESEAKFVHERENGLSLMADAVRATARRSADPSVLAPFEKLLEYNSQAAIKAVKTRRRNAKAALEAAAEAEAEETIETV